MLIVDFGEFETKKLLNQQFARPPYVPPQDCHQLDFQSHHFGSSLAGCSVDPGVVLILTSWVFPLWIEESEIW